MRNKFDERRILGLTDGKDYGINPPPMKAQTAVEELCRYFLGDEWYTPLPLGAEQVNTVIVMEIEKRYKGARCRRTSNAD